ncbi:MTH1187 family thiamine-binding protein [Nocardia sp. NPDC047654]|uniref:thiamine-binding protein n=1 Tax=Nocardia sp. NPDC047654 TaxID=3364314 RepID=UPI00370FA9F4
MIIAFSVTPHGTGVDVGRAVAEAVRVVRASGLPNHTDAMFTTVEGEWDEVMAVVKQATDAILAVAPRCSLVLKGDIRPGVTDAISAKVEKVERYLAEGWQRFRPAHCP